MHLTRQIHAVVLLLPLLSGSSAAAPAIGVATASGKFTLDRANHRSNATLFEGNTFDSGTSELEFRLASGTTVQLGAAARGAIFHDHILLRDGGGDVRPGTAYMVEALNLQVKPVQPGAVARVVVKGGQVRVGALRGDLQVLNGKGTLLARVSQGEADAFTPVDGAATGTGAAAGAATGAGAAAGAAGGAGVGAIAGGGAAAGSISTAVIVAGVVVASVGAATGIAVAATSGNGDTTLSPSAR